MLRRKYRTVSGKEVVKNLCRNFGGEVVSQKGSHIKVKFLTGKKTIVPDHRELDRFTLNGVLDLADISLEDFFERL